jgi:hypothetical protein
MQDILIRYNDLRIFDRDPRDVVAVPPDATYIAESAWAIMCKEAGGEAKLIEALGVKDCREGDDA